MPKEETLPAVILTCESIQFRGEVLEELRARHRIYRLVRDTAFEYVHKDFYWTDENPLGDSIIFAAANEFVDAILDSVGSQTNQPNAVQEGIANLHKVWPPDLAEEFDEKTGLLPLVGS